MASISVGVKELKELVAQVKLVEDKTAGVISNHLLVRNDGGKCSISVANTVGIYTRQLQCDGPREPFLAYIPILKTITSQVKSGVCHIYPDKVTAGDIEILKDTTEDVSVEDFPKEVGKGKHPIEFELKDLTVLRQVFFNTKDEVFTHYYKTSGIYFHLENGVLDIVQTDGVRLVRVRVPVTTKEDHTISFLCPQNVCRFLVKQTGPVVISASTEAIEFQSSPNGWTYIFKNTTGNYPNYNSVLNRAESTAIVKVDVKQIISKLNSCKDEVIILSIKDHQATVSSKTTKLGVIGSEQLGGQLDIGIAREKIVKLFSLVDPGKPLILYLTTPKEPIFMAPEGSQYWLGAISPVTI